MRKLTYAESGVDIHLENRSIDAMKAVLTTTRQGFGAPMTEIGHYAGLLDMGSFALAMTTDGVGSKVLIANAIQKWDTVGIDCIAMNVNDLYAIGAEPIAFVDYLAVEKVDPERAAQIAIGLRRGAELSNMTIVGGETASLPEIIRGFDLAGTAIGVVDKDKIVTGEKSSGGRHAGGSAGRRTAQQRLHPGPQNHRRVKIHLLRPDAGRRQYHRRGASHAHQDLP